MREDHPGIANAILLKSLHHGYLRRGPVELSLPHRVQSPIQFPINISKYLDLANETSAQAYITYTTGEAVPDEGECAHCLVLRAC